MTRPAALDLVVLTSGLFGIEVAAALARLPETKSIAIVTAPIGRGRTPLRTKIRNLYRLHGPRGLLDAALGRLRHPRPEVTLAARIRARCPAAEHLPVRDFHDPEAIEAIRARRPDLGVVAATYLLRPAVFSLPRLGCVNLHLGHAPEFRGSSPGFYEMLQGVGEVGVTIHRVTEALDGGNILRQESVPLDLAPPGDPVAYLQRLQLEVLGPLGVRLMAETVAQIARGTAREWSQDHTRAHTYRRATYALKRELRRVVAARRQASVR